MICPCRHIDDIILMNTGEKLEIMELLSKVLEALKTTIDPEGFNIGINLGRAAGAGLEEHVHIHIVPRWNGDTNFMPVAGDIKVVPQLLLDLWDELHPVLNS